MAADRHLLLGLLALQNGLIQPPQLVAGFHAWTGDKSRSLADHLIALGYLTVTQRSVIEALAELHVEAHGGDVEKSVAAVPTGMSTLASLADVGDPDIERTLSYVGRRHGPTADGDADRTASYAMGAATGDGQRFRVLRPHARGGLGAVSVALDAELNREVALKQILDDQADDPVTRRRFLLEGEITGRLEHPGVVPVYGLGTDGQGRPFYAMRFVKGSTLKEVITRFHQERAGQASPQAQDALVGLKLHQLVGRLIAVCNTMSYAHSRGILHRDLKPSNILLGPFGETLIVDWGLAKAMGRWEDSDATGTNEGPVEGSLRPSSGSRVGETVTGTAIGTPAYMSPEQAEGRLDRLGPASDVYSLGATLYYVLAGRPPFDDDGDLPRLFSKIRLGDFPRPRAIDPHIPGALEAVCMKAMALRPEERHASPRALAADLEHWLADEPIPGHRESFATRATRWGRRHKAAALAIAVLLLSAVTALGISTTLIGHEQAETERQRRIATAKAGETAAKAEMLERQLYVNRINLARREAENDVARAEAYLSLCPETLRGWEWRFLERYCHLESATLGGHAQPVNAVAFTADGSHVVTGAGKQYYAAKREDAADLVVWDARSGQEIRRLTGLAGAVNAVATSPDGTLLAAASGVHEPAAGRITVWELRTGRLAFDRPVEALTGLSVVFSPDGKTLAAGLGSYSSTEPGRLVLWNHSDGRQLVDLPSQPGGVNAVAFSPDGTLVAGACSGVIEIWDVGPVARGALPVKRRDIRGQPDWIYTVAFSPDGRRLASGGWDKTVRLWDVATGQPTQSIGIDSVVYGLAFTTDGARLAITRQASVALWELATGRLVRVYRGHRESVNAVALSPDGRRLVSGSSDRTAKLWELDAGLPRVVAAHQGWVNRLLFSRDGSRIFSASGDHTVAVWDSIKWQRLHSLDDQTWVFDIALTPDETLLATAHFGGQHVRLYDTTTWKLVHHWDLAGSNPHCVAISADGSRLAYGTAPPDDSSETKGIVQVWDLTTGHDLVQFEGHSDRVFDLAFDPTGRTIASVGGHKTSRAGEVKLWHSDTGRAVRGCNGHTGFVRSVAFSPDGTRLATAGDDGTVRFWDPETGKPIRRVEVSTTRLECLCFSPDGSRLAAGDDHGAVKLLDPATGDEIMILPGSSSSQAMCLAFSPDGHRLLSGSVDRMIRVWDAGPANQEGGR
jgi:WD40 repeat protein/serine/threonine protein kinase